MRFGGRGRYMFIISKIFARERCRRVAPGCINNVDIRLLFKSCQYAAIHVHTIHINENERR